MNTASTAALAPPRHQIGLLAWIRANLFSSPVNAIVTVLSVWFLLMSVPAALNWLFFDANLEATSAQQCRQASGACWAFIREKHRLILFGIYPYDEQWRPLLATILLTGLIICSCIRWFWKAWLPLFWMAGLALVAVLMWGGVFGLSYVDNSMWGGLPLTLILATFGIAFAFPLGLLLALGRTSRLPAVKALCVVYIELIRGVPLISLLFMSSVMLPLFLPAGFNIDKLLRAQIAIILFAAAYIAETVRGGLQAIPKGQYEGAESLGLSYWQTMRMIILPQALKVVIPPLVSIFIALFKDTSLVVIIGIFDLTQAAKTALADASWRGFSAEAYLFIALIYFAYCYSISRYSRALERRLATDHER